MESRKGRVEEVILIRLYKVPELISSILLSTTKSSFINDKVNNLIKYIKFI